MDQRAEVTLGKVEPPAINKDLFSFVNITERGGTDSLKWDGVCDKFGRSVFPMWIADMDFPAADCILIALENRLRHPVYGYPDHDDSVQHAAATWMAKRHRWDSNPDDFILIQGVVPALYAAIRAFSKPGSSVITMPPIYPPFLGAITDNDRKILSVPLLEELGGRYVMNFKGLELAMKTSKLLMFCSPHNPVGRTWTREELHQLTSLAAKYEVQIVSDEMHADLSFDAHPHTPMPLVDAGCIFLGAASKSFNIAGIGGAVAWVTDSEKRQIFVEELNRSRNLGMHTFAKVASKAAWLGGADWQKALQAHFLDNAEYIRKRLANDLPRVQYRLPEFGYLAWIDLRPLGLSNDLISAKLLEVGLGLNPGSSFGSEGSGFVRLNFGTPHALLEKGMNLFEKAFT